MPAAPVWSSSGTWTKAGCLLHGSDGCCLTPIGAAFVRLCPPKAGSLLTNNSTKMPPGEWREHLLMKLGQKSWWEDGEAAEWTDNPRNCTKLMSLKNPNTLLGQRGNSPPNYEEDKSLQTEEEADKEPLSNIASKSAENYTLPSTWSLGNLQDRPSDLPLHQLINKSGQGQSQLLDKVLMNYKPC